MLLSCGGGGTTSNVPTNLQVATVELNGDSIMFGPNLADHPAGYMEKQKPTWIIDDRGVLGLTLDSFVNGYKEPFLNADKSYYPRGPQLPFVDVPRSSKIVVIELGGNDALQQSTFDNFEVNLRKVITQLLSENRVPILTGVVPVIPSGIVTQEVVNRIVYINYLTRKVSSEYSIAHAQWDMMNVDFATETFDGIHRKQDASNNLVKSLITTIEASLSTL